MWYKAFCKLPIPSPTWRLLTQDLRGACSRSTTTTFLRDLHGAVGASLSRRTSRLHPGSYTGISIVATFLGNVTFQAGNYTIGGSGLSLKGGASVNGNNVMFYLNGGAVAFNNSQQINLSAPTAGAYAGILFFQRKGNTAAATVTGAGGSNLTGGLYFPGATINLNGAINNPNYLIVVAKTINVNTNVTTQSSYLSLPNGSPIKAATLVQ